MQNWAIALVKLAQEEEKVDLLLKQAIKLKDLFFANREIIDILASNNLKKPQRKKIIDHIFKNQINDIFINFFKLLIDQNCFRQVLTIIKNFRDICNELNNVAYGTVFSTIKLKKEQVLKIEAKISKNLHQKIELVNKIDPSLIAGIKIKIKDKIFDGSIKGRLLAMKQSIKNS